ncbi:MAG: transporter related [Pedosphaera sp.]|nr:transporter related [Pedosphaera sp.]
MPAATARGTGDYCVLDFDHAPFKNAGMARVVIENLTKIFKGPAGEIIRAVNRANLVVEDKEFLVLVGPSGCGKSSTLRMIAGLDEVSEGTISIDGRVVNKVEPKDRDIAMVFQNYALYPHMSVYENMAFGLKLRNIARTEIEQRVREAAATLDLADCLNRKPKELSGGQRQRVAVGRAIVRKPKVFLFDEPLSNLDAPMRAQMRREISKLHTQLASTMLFVTHDQSEAMTMGDRIAVMKDGIIQQVALPMEVYHQPANLFVAGFIGSPAMNLFRGMLERRDGGLFFHEQPGQSGDAKSFAVRVEAEMAARLGDFIGRHIVLGIRPEHIAERLQLREATDACTIEAVAELVEPLGAETYLYAASGAHSLTARMQPGYRAAAKEKVLLVLDMRHAHFFDPDTEKRIG